MASAFASTPSASLLPAVAEPVPTWSPCTESASPGAPPPSVATVDPTSLGTSGVWRQDEPATAELMSAPPPFSPTLVVEAWEGEAGFCFANMQSLSAMSDCSLRSFEELRLRHHQASAAAASACPSPLATQGTAQGYPGPTLQTPPIAAADSGSDGSASPIMVDHEEGEGLCFAVMQSLPEHFGSSFEESRLRHYRERVPGPLSGQSLAPSHGQPGPSLSAAPSSLAGSTSSAPRDPKGKRVLQGWEAAEHLQKAAYHPTLIDYYGSGEADGYEMMISVTGMLQHSETSCEELRFAQYCRARDPSSQAAQHSSASEQPWRGNSAAAADTGRSAGPSSAHAPNQASAGDAARPLGVLVSEDSSRHERPTPSAEATAPGNAQEPGTAGSPGSGRPVTVVGHENAEGAGGISNNAPLPFNIDLMLEALAATSEEQQENLMRVALEDFVDQCISRGFADIGPLRRVVLESSMDLALLALEHVNRPFLAGARSERLRVMRGPLEHIVLLIGSNNGSRQSSRPGDVYGSNQADGRRPEGSGVLQGKMSPSPVPEDLDAIPEEELCVVCMAGRKAAAFVPCGHMVCCMACAQELQDRGSGRRASFPSAPLPGSSMGLGLHHSVFDTPFGMPPPVLAFPATPPTGQQAYQQAFASSSAHRASPAPSSGPFRFCGTAPSPAPPAPSSGPFQFGSSSASPNLAPPAQLPGPFGPFGLGNSSLSAAIPDLTSDRFYFGSRAHSSTTESHRAPVPSSTAPPIQASPGFSFGPSHYNPTLVRARELQQEFLLQGSLWPLGPAARATPVTNGASGSSAARATGESLPPFGPRAAGNTKSFRCPVCRERCSTFVRVRK